MNANHLGSTKRLNIYRRYRRFVEREFNCSIVTINVVLRDYFNKIRDNHNYNYRHDNISVTILRIQYMKWMLENKDLILLKLL